jgi:integrase/recombinase XerD
MKKNDITTAIILEKRKPRKKNNPKEETRYPVKLRITYKREQQYYTCRNKTGESIALSENDFNKIKGERPSKLYKNMAVYLNQLESQAVDIIEKIMPVFTFSAFEKKYFTDIEDEADLFSGLKAMIKQLTSEGRISTASAYQCTYNSLEKYTGKTSLSYLDVDAAFLNKYEKWMLKEGKSSTGKKELEEKQGNSPTTVGIYLRNVRAMFNKAVNSGTLGKEYYPFGEAKYSIPGGKNIKKALTQSDVGLIANYPAIEGTQEQLYRDYWLFSYLCNGINIKDMALLKYGNIEGDVIVLKRAKTLREKKKDPRLITIIITKQIGRIIDTWGNKSHKRDDYIFPILKPDLTPQEEYAYIQQTTKMINKHIKKIAKDLQITQKVTTYTARHSFATVLKRSGASVEFISESLGHSNLATTENYLADFEIEEKKKWAEKLTDF